MENNAVLKNVPTNIHKYSIDTKTQELTSVVFVMNPNDLRAKKKKKSKENRKEAYSPWRILTRTPLPSIFAILLRRPIFSRSLYTLLNLHA